MDPNPVDNQRRPGYEYCHHIEIDDDRINTKRQIRTNFIPKPRDVGAVQSTLCSETIVERVLCCDHEGELFICSQIRLREYWMPEAQIQGLIHEAFDLFNWHLIK
ncbi:2-oxoglutarate dehydrogenase [Striga asiatica]|uniref:2-oxoglutarate dehydrogenase n=1 Tax=Striga asiatica TaxID=4170 RepID=A0A5A7R2S1_STRAF|nr:2-oxoglutarate dehydrogenase [Striga asiatica]